MDCMSEEVLNGTKIMYEQKHTNPSFERDRDNIAAVIFDLSCPLHHDVTPLILQAISKLPLYTGAISL